MAVRVVSASRNPHSLRLLRMHNGASVPWGDLGVCSGRPYMNRLSLETESKMKHAGFALFATAALIAVAATTPVVAQSVNISIGTPPPAPIVETVPPPRAGFVWAPGFWRWEGERHVWMSGHWIEERVGHRWIPDHWIEGPNGGWRYVPGHWA